MDGPGVPKLGRLASPTLGRNTALMERASEMPAAVITRLLGISLNRATHWTQTRVTPGPATPQNLPAAVPPSRVLLGPVCCQVPDLAEEFADVIALGADLMVGSLEGVLGVQCPLLPCRFQPGLIGSLIVASARLPNEMI